MPPFAEGPGPHDPSWRLVRSVLDHPRRWLAVIALATAVVGLGVLRLELRTDGAAIYPTGDATVEHTERDGRLFNEPVQVIVLVTSRSGGRTLDSPEGLRFLKRLHTSLQGVPGVEAHRVRSLASLLDPRPGTPLFRMETFLEEIPEGGRGHRELLERIRASPLANGLFLSADGMAAALYAPASRYQSREELLGELERWVEGERTEVFELRLTGPLAAEVMLGRAVMGDLAQLVPLMVAVIAGLISVFLRSFGGVIVALSEILMVLLWTLGAMGFCGVPITLVTTILPVILMTVSVTDEVHLLDRFREHLAGNGSAGAEVAPVGRHRAIEAALHDVARPIVLTSLTTAIAFLSFLAAPMAPIRHLGLFTSLGVLLAMGLSFTLVPALTLVLPSSWFREKGPRRPSRIPAHERFLIRWRAPAVWVGLLLIPISVPGLLRLSIQDSWIDNFDPGSALPVADRLYNGHFWGSYRFDIVLTRDEKGYFQRAEGLRLFEQLRQIARATPHAGGVASHLLAFETAAEALEAGGPVSALPAGTISEIAADLGTIEPRIDLDHYLRFDGSAARLRIFVKGADYRLGRELEGYLGPRLEALLEGRGVAHHFSGDLPAADAVVHAIVTNMLRSVGWTVVGVGLLLGIAWRRLGAAAAAMAPLLSAIPIFLGAIGYAGIALGVATSLFVAVTIGVAVDFAVHLSHAYHRTRRAGVAPEAALAASLAITGRAIRWNAAVLAVGLSVLTLSALKPNRSLGLLLSTAILTCYATTWILLPRLLERSRAER